MLRYTSKTAKGLRIILDYLGGIPMNSITNKLSRARPTMLAIVILGSVWGLLEMSLGGFLHTIHFARDINLLGIDNQQIPRLSACP